MSNCIIIKLIILLNKSDDFVKRYECLISKEYYLFIDW